MRVYWAEGSEEERVSSNIGMRDWRVWAKNTGRGRFVDDMVKSLDDSLSLPLRFSSVGKKQAAILCWPCGHQPVT